MKSLSRSLTLLIATSVAATSLLTLSYLWSDYRSGRAVERAFVAKDVTADILPPPMYLIELRLVLSQAIEGTLPRQRAIEEVERLKREYVARVDYWTAHPPYGLEAKLLDAQREIDRGFITQAERVLKVMLGGDPAATLVSLKEADAAYLLHRAVVNDSVKASTAFASEAVSDFDATRTQVVWLIWVMFGVAALLMVGIGYRIRHGIMSAVGGEPSAAAAAAKAIAAGDLTVHVPVVAGDTVSVMAEMLNLRDNLAQVVGQVRTGTDTVATASSQIAAGNLDLSSRTEQQASSLEETASSMEELTSTVKQNAENARQANQLVVSTSDIAVKGGEVVGQVVDTMVSIKDSSRKISDIIGVIDGIAFQTNILALNAAVEAARAGEQGRGFAVVASEVRNLAQRSASAAKEIKSLIEDSVGKVDAGGQLVDEAGKTMGEIVASVKRVTDIMSEIAAASQEQSAGIEQVNQAITQMDDVTQQNAALVEEAAAAAESLQDQAGKLAEVVSVFKLEGSSRGVRPASPARQGATSALPKPKGAPTRAMASQKKLAAAGGGNEEWEEF